MSKFDSSKLKISEHFYSIQGEGKTTGVPAYFIRLTNCNLTCGASRKLVNQITKGELDVDPNSSWHGDLHLNGEATWTCDSIPVWAKGEDAEFQYLIDSWEEQGIYENIKNRIIHIVWTGGEPTIPQHQEAIINFHKHLLNYDNGSPVITSNDINNPSTVKYYWNGLSEDKKIEMMSLNTFDEIETNGTYIIGDLFNVLDQINCSPKLSNSGMTPKQRIVPNAINRIMEHRNYQFKFVVGTEEDIKEVFRDFIDVFNIPLTKVCMMPALDNQEDYHERTNFICEMAKKYKFIAAQRLHISSWAAVTGV
jgi:7-carboxy-7-deazaguanine synthase